MKESHHIKTTFVISVLPLLLYFSLVSFHTIQPGYIKSNASSQFDACVESLTLKKWERNGHVKIIYVQEFFKYKVHKGQETLREGKTDAWVHKWHAGVSQLGRRTRQFPVAPSKCVSVGAGSCEDSTNVWGSQVSSWPGGATGGLQKRP